MTNDSRESGKEPDLMANLLKSLQEKRAAREIPPYEPPYTGDEPLGTCPIHGDYWTDDCLRCGR